VKLLQNYNTENFKDKPIIIKGCTNKPIPSSAFTMLIQKLHPVAKTIMYGEACSTVPISKRKKDSYTI
jgi:hypothetical protein